MKNSILFFGSGILLVAACAGIEWINQQYHVPVFMIAAVALSLWKVVPYVVNKYGK